MRRLHFFMSMRISRLDECPLDPIAGWTLGVCGYGNQGRAHALNARDSGLRVLIGADDADRPSAAQALRDGLEVVPLIRLGREAEVVAMLAPDDLQAELVGQIRAVATSGSDSPDEASGSLKVRAWAFAHGFSLVYDRPPFGPTDDVFVVAPASPGVQVRTRYEAGHGVPALLAIDSDPSGQCESLAKAYGTAIGCSRAGLLHSSVRDEVDIDLFGEQSVLCGGMNALTTAAFETLVDAGYAPEAAYLECVHQLRLTAELVESYGIEGMRRRISTTALFGDISRGPRVGTAELREALRSILDDVRSGEFAREWLDVRRQNPGWARQAPGENRKSDLEDAGETIRGLFQDDKND